jgi:CHAD domain-containing protein
MAKHPHDSPLDSLRDAALDASREPAVRRAALATAAAVGAGAAAKVSLDLRSAAHAPEHDREFAVHRHEPLGSGLRRVARGQADTAVELLTPATGLLSDHAVHESRKAIKRLRAMARLLRGELGPRRFQRENAALRDAGRRLAGARDAEVVVDTLERLIEKDLEQPVSPGVAALRAELIVERQVAQERLLADAGVAAGTAEDVQAVRRRAAHWVRPSAGFNALEPGLERTYRQGRRRFRRAEADPTVENLHDWRKRVKDLRHAAEVLAPADPKRIGKVARRADRLGETLGADHDLAVLADLVGRSRDLFTDDAERRQVLKVIERRRGRLQRRAMKRAGKLYQRKPRRFSARMRRRWGTGSA